MNLLLLLLLPLLPLLSSPTPPTAAAAAVLRPHNTTTDLTPFTFLGRCTVPAAHQRPTLAELGGLSPHSVKRCQNQDQHPNPNPNQSQVSVPGSSSPAADDVAALSRSILKRRMCCVRKHGAAKCSTLRRVGGAEAIICGEPGWCHPCGMVAVLVADIAKSCRWGQGGEVLAAGTWNVKVGGRGSVMVLGM